MRRGEDPFVVVVTKVVDQLFETLANTPGIADADQGAQEWITDRFAKAIDFRGWSREGIRAVMLAVLQHAPVEDLAMFVKIAGREMGSLAGWVAACEREASADADGAEARQ